MWMIKGSEYAEMVLVERSNIKISDVADNVFMVEAPCLWLIIRYNYIPIILVILTMSVPGPSG
jgi:hypothetical protein